MDGHFLKTCLVDHYQTNNKDILGQKTQRTQQSKLSNPHNTQDFHHLHTYTQNYISLHFYIHVNTKVCHIHHKRRVT